jgi:hypothetical protein
MRRSLKGIQSFGMASPPLGARILVFGFFGSFLVVGALFIAISLKTIAERVAFLESATHTQGTILEMRPVYATRHGAGTLIPVFKYTASDGQSYMIVSGVSVRASVFRVNQQVPVLYRVGEPNSAVLDSYGPLWQYATVFGVVGAAFFGFPAILFYRYWRSRRAESSLGALES